MITASTESIERSCRRSLAKEGLLLRKSTAKLKDGGGYMIMDGNTNTVAAGSDFELDLLDVMNYISGVATTEAIYRHAVKSAGKEARA